ncbi:MAG: hypothetical protein K6T81_15605 [Alicyclobacillus macrosporangiidus]|uniref:hypothetical protein n=1 Tax=Alicyclobacillus macrosporangiidus TaxID=392015 RepID=UPI0026ED5A1D|nr:hypothetical protein [Alicyclobacillus macrosporangiidus]MCL6600143.1 hypothetical protein [Alicyclobacillus macrosporangiidus]
MGKKIGFSSPIGITITVAGLILALSPQARSAIRRLMVKGTASAMDAMEKVGGLTAGILNIAPAVAGRQEWVDKEQAVETPIQPAASTSEQTTDIDGSDEERNE